MTVNNVNALLNYTKTQPVSQADQTGLKQDELTKDSFGQVMTKLSDTIKSLQMESAGTVASVFSTALLSFCCVASSVLPESSCMGLSVPCTCKFLSALAVSIGSAGCTADATVPADSIWRLLIVSLNFVMT